MQRLATTILVTALAVIGLVACDSIPGMGQQEAQPAAPPAIPQAQPAPQAVPQPTAAQPVATQPVAMVPGQVPTQPGVVEPTPAIPGQPMAMPGVQQPTAEMAQPATPPTPTGDALTDKLNAKKFELAAAFTPTSAMVKQTVEKGKSQSYQVQLPGPPYCHTYMAVADDKVGNVDIAIESSVGTVEAKDASEESTAVVLNHCPTMPGAYKLTVSMPAAGGEFAVQVFSK